MLSALWDLGPSSARTVHDRVGVPALLAYTTIATVLERLYSKGLASRSKDGRIVVYEACRSRDEVERARTAAVLKGIFGAAPRPALATLVDAVEDVDPDLVDELARLVKARQKARRGS